mmetsp:Transcript_5181/g.16611  ORF Transcript_5181/g.16611 Transcript_5181/m.16611 type:complete len:225 (+) Transcript_5181:431-1105(+)
MFYPGRDHLSISMAFIDKPGKDAAQTVDADQQIPVLPAVRGGLPEDRVAFQAAATAARVDLCLVERRYVDEDGLVPKGGVCSLFGLVPHFKNVCCCIQTTAVSPSEYSVVTSLRGSLSLSQPRATTPLETALPRHLERTRANQESSACGKRLTRSWRSRRSSSPRTSFRTPPCGRPTPSRSFTIVLRSCRTSLAIVRALAPPAASSRARAAPRGSERSKPCPRP